MTTWSPLWPAAARGLSNHLWQSTLFAVAAALLAFALRRYPARARYWLWLCASAKFLIPFSLLIAAGSHLGRPTHTTPAHTTAYIAIDEMSQPFTEAPVLSGPAPLAPQPSSTHPLARLPILLAALWLCGFSAVLAFWLVQWRRVAKSIRNATLLLTGRVPETLRRIEALARIPHPIAILSSPASLEYGSLEPGVFGVLRPVLLWPEAISPHLDDAHLEAILAHEAAHVRRRDNLTALLPMLVEATFWFHPLVWWMESQLVKERERACDEEVLLLCHRPQAYAESILKVCELCIESPLTCVSGITGADLKRRIVQIMTAPIARKLGLGAKLLLLSAASLAIAMPILLGHATAAQRMMLAAVNAAPSPIRTAAHAMIALEQTPSTGLIAEAQPPSAPADNAGPVGDEMSLGPEFEVATIRPTDPKKHDNGNWVNSSGRFEGHNTTLRGLVRFAYGSFPHPSGDSASGGPDWAGSDHFDVEAKVDDAQMANWSKMSDEQRIELVKPMLRRLLVERFQLKLHTETQVKDVYALVQAKGGAKLKEVAPPPPINDDEAQRQNLRDSMAQKSPKPIAGSFMMSGDGWFGNSIPIGMLLSEVAVNAHLDAPLVDQTGLRGYYDFSMKVSYDKDAPLLIDQVETQLGLKVEPRKLPLKVYVIDSAEKPSVDGAELPNPPTPIFSRVALAQANPAPTPAPASSPLSPPKSFDRLVSASLEGPAHDLGPGHGMVAWALPVYPSEAKAARIQGVVALKVTIAETGTVENVQAISGPQELRQTTIDAVKQWKFDPAWDHGFSVGVKTIGVIYSLPSLVPVVGPVPPPEEAAAGAKQFGGDITQPLMILRNDPEYTTQARTDKVEGAVTVSLVVDEHGVPQHVQVARGLGDGLDEKAVEAAKKDRFSSARQNGNPVAVFLYVPIDFKLN